MKKAFRFPEHFLLQSEKLQLPQPLFSNYGDAQQVHSAACLLSEITLDEKGHQIQNSACKYLGQNPREAEAWGRVCVYTFSVLSYEESAYLAAHLFSPWQYPMAGLCQENASNTLRSLGMSWEVGEEKCLLLVSVRGKSSSICRQAGCSVLLLCRNSRW